MKRGVVILLAFLFVISLVVASNELTISPYLTTNTSNISLSLAATNYSAVWANITSPDGSTIRINNQTNITFSNTSLIGRYNVTYFINNTEGNVTNTTDYFEIFEPSTFIGDFMGYNSSINYSYHFYYRENILYNGSTNESLSIEIPNTIYDLEYKFYLDNLQLYFSEINTSHSNKTINLNNVSTIGGYYINYAINSTYNITNTTIKLYYDDLSIEDESMLNLHKCNNWSYINQTCLSSWSNITSNLVRDTTNNLFSYTFNSTIDFALGINETAEEEEEDGTGESTTITDNTEDDAEDDTIPETTSGNDDSEEDTMDWDLSEFEFNIGENETVEIISEGGEYQITLGNTTYNISIYNITDEGANFDIKGMIYGISFHETKEFTVDEHAVRVSYLEKSEDKVKISFTRIISGIELEASPIFGAIYEFVGGLIARNLLILITITFITAIISHRDNPQKKKSRSKKKK